MKIIFFNNTYPSDKFPNEGSYAKTIFDILRKTGNTIEKCVLRKTQNKAQDYFKYYSDLTTINLSDRNDILYINHLTFAVPLILRLLFLNRKTIFHWHGEELVSNNFVFVILRSLMRNCFKENSVHISPSKYYKKVIQDKLGVLERDIIVSPSGGVNLDTFKQKSTNPISDTVHIGFPAALNKHKGVVYLYQIIRKIAELEKLLELKVVVHIINYGEESNELINDIIQQEYNFVRIHNKFKKEDMCEFYANLNISLFLSQRESLGLTVLESMSCGVPVIARNNTSMTELIVTELSGELIDNHFNIEDLFLTINKVVRNIDKYDPRSFVKQNYSEEIVLDQYKAIIRNFSRKIYL